MLALGSHIPDRHDKVSHADGWILTRYRAKVQVYIGLREDDLEDGRYKSVHAGIDPYAYSVRRRKLRSILRLAYDSRFFSSSPFANGATFLGFEMAMRVLNGA